MVFSRPQLAVAGLLAGAGAALGACGTSGSSSAPARLPATTRSPTQGSPPTQPPSGATGPRGSHGPRAPGTSSTGGAQAPPHGAASGSRGSGPAVAAVATLSRLGYTVLDRSVYHPAQSLRVLIGVGRDSLGQRAERAFFFLIGRYLGTDARDPSGQLSVSGQSDTTITILYRLYRTRDRQCCPTGPSRPVRFQLNNGRLAALNPIPPASSSALLSRR